MSSLPISNESAFQRINSQPTNPEDLGLYSLSYAASLTQARQPIRIQPIVIRRVYENLPIRVEPTVYRVAEASRAIQNPPVNNVHSEAVRNVEPMQHEPTTPTAAEDNRVIQNPPVNNVLQESINRINPPPRQMPLNFGVYRQTFQQRDIPTRLVWVKNFSNDDVGQPGRKWYHALYCSVDRNCNPKACRHGYGLKNAKVCDARLKRIEGMSIAPYIDKPEN